MWPAVMARYKRMKQEQSRSKADDSTEAAERNAGPGQGVRHGR